MIVTRNKASIFCKATIDLTVRTEPQRTQTTSVLVDCENRLIMSVIAAEHHPGILEKNKVLDFKLRTLVHNSISASESNITLQTIEEQQAHITGPILNDSTHSRLFFTPAGELVSQGWRAPLREEQVWRLDEENTADRIWEKLQPEWTAELKKPK